MKMYIKLQKERKTESKRVKEAERNSSAAIRVLFLTHEHLHVRVHLAGPRVLHGVVGHPRVRLPSAGGSVGLPEPPPGQPEHLRELLQGQVQRGVPLGEDQGVEVADLEDVGGGGGQGRLQAGERGLKSCAVAVPAEIAIRSGRDCFFLPI